MGHIFPKTWAKSSIITGSSSKRPEDRGHVMSLPDGSTWQEREQAYNGRGGCHKALGEEMLFLECISGCASALHLIQILDEIRI